MVFLRPVVMRDAEQRQPALARPLRADPRPAAGQRSRRRSVLLPINESPVLPLQLPGAAADAAAEPRRRRAPLAAARRHRRRSPAVPAAGRLGRYLN